MLPNDAKTLVRQYVERVWNQAEPGALDELTAPDFVYHLGGQPGRDRDGMQKFVASVHVAFPDWRVDIVDCIAEGETVAVRWHGKVTHLGAFHTIAPSGKQISVSGINVYSLAQGRIVAEWEQMDSLGMLQQLGALKPA
jgi:steroid delta-isomerase-like uncharacterized protein